MTPEIATPADSPAIYALLYEARFHNLPAFGEAKDTLEAVNALLLKDGDKVVLWAGFSGEQQVMMDLVIAPELPRRTITQGLVKSVLAHGLNLSQDGCIIAEAYNPKGVKAALKMGFRMGENRDQDGWVRLVLTREDYERKFTMRGKTL